MLGEKNGRGNRNAATTGKRYSTDAYPDEPLNPRIVNPALKLTLVATIDRVPCTVQLTPLWPTLTVQEPCPLNTLANAVLAQSDKLRQMASQNYDNGRQETIVADTGHSIIL